MGNICTHRIQNVIAFGFQGGCKQRLHHAGREDQFGAFAQQIGADFAEQFTGFFLIGNNSAVSAAFEFVEYFEHSFARINPFDLDLTIDRFSNEFGFICSGASEITELFNRIFLQLFDTGLKNIGDRRRDFSLNFI